jgi:hypothetical protein
MKKSKNKSILNLRAVEGIKLITMFAKTNYFMLENSPHLIDYRGYDYSIDNIFSQKDFNESFCIAFYYQFLGSDDLYELNALIKIFNNETNLKKLYDLYYNSHKEFNSLTYFKFGSTSSIPNFSIEPKITVNELNMTFENYLDITISQITDKELING